MSVYCVSVSIKLLSKGIFFYHKRWLALLAIFFLFSCWKGKVTGNVQHCFLITDCWLAFAVVSVEGKKKLVDLGVFIHRLLACTGIVFTDFSNKTKKSAEGKRLPESCRAAF